MYCVSTLPFETVEEVLGELVYVEHLVSDDCEVQAVTKGRLPQVLRVSIGI